MDVTALEVQGRVGEGERGRVERGGVERCGHGGRAVERCRVVRRGGQRRRGQGCESGQGGVELVGEDVRALDDAATPQVRMDGRGLQAIGKVADIARPGGGLDRADRVLAEGLVRQAMALAGFTGEGEAEQHEVFAAFGERRDVSLEHP
jgi:hypothetical protein